MSRLISNSKAKLSCDDVTGKWGCLKSMIFIRILTDIFVNKGIGKSTHSTELN